MTPAARPVPAPVPWTGYVAIGDSFTEGLWDEPGPHGRPRGWADRLADSLSARRVAGGAPPLRYANLAIRGRLLDTILTDQLDAALALGPDLVSVVGGGNDLLRLGADPDRLAAALDAAVARARTAGADVLLATGTDPADSPMVRHTRGRVAVLNAHVWSIARRHGASVLDLWGMRALRDWRMWADDRIHLTPDGHARVAQAALVGLGLAPDDPEWATPLPPQPPLRGRARAEWNARWAREHLAPWVARHVRGRSSGDGLPPKAAHLEPLPPATAAGSGD